jgi:TRAP-type C4-dicarboxylate transport system substrate-binding protein
MRPRLLARRTLLGAAGGVLAAPAVLAQAPVTLRFATHEPEDAFVYAGTWKPWLERVLQETGGALQIDAFTGGRMAPSSEAHLDLVLSGKADIAFIVPPIFRDRFLEQDLFMQPGLLRDAREASLAATRLQARGLLSGFDGLVPLGVLVAAPSAVHATVPVGRPEDLRGRRFNTNAALTVDLFRRLGADMSLTYVTPRAAATLRANQFDGVIADWVGSDTFGTLAAAHHHLDYPLGGVMLAFVINRTSYDRLPGAIRAAFDRHKGDELADGFGRAFDGRRRDVVARVRSEAGQSVVTPEGAAAAAWADAFAPGVEAWRTANPRNGLLARALDAELASIRAT